VQDRYAGDIGDFGKYGLLRYICSVENGISSLKLGVNWYLVPDGGNVGDGGFTEYLQDDLYPSFSKLKICNPQLYETLKNIVFPGKEDKHLVLQGEKERKTCPHEGCPGKKSTVECLTRRCTYKIEHRDVLPEDTVYYNRKLNFPVNSTAGERKALRADWVDEGFEKLKSCDIVFFDPDNGFQVLSSGRHGQEGVKYVFDDEVAGYYKRGQSIIIYQHRSREPEEIYIERIKSSLHAITNQESAGALRLRYNRGTARDFILLPNRSKPWHREAIERRIGEMLGTEWKWHFKKLFI